jgi:hypothetical protein
MIFLVLSIELMMYMIEHVCGRFFLFIKKRVDEGMFEIEISHLQENQEIYHGTPSLVGRIKPC